VPWSSHAIWVDHQPFESRYTSQDDGSAPAARERPRPGEINHVCAQVFNSGPDDATDVKLTFYAVSPPGVGDNGAWTPIGQRTVPIVAGGNAAAEYVSWTPCAEPCGLKVVAAPQFGEITASNNQAQENVFYFAPAAGRVVDPVRMPIAVRNPLDEEASIVLAPAFVPAGYLLHLPHRWVNLPAKGERTLELTLIPHLDLETYRRDADGCADLCIRGFVDHRYQADVDSGRTPCATVRAVGGLTVSVTPKQRAEIEAQVDAERSDGIGITGAVQPALGGQRITVRVQPVGSAAFRVETVTDRRGRFRLFIDPRRLIGQARRPWEGQLALRLDGVYEVYCETFDARDLAYARSPRLYFDFRRATEPGQPELFARPRSAPELVETALQQTLGDTPEPASTRTGAPPARRRYRRPTRKPEITNP
jgi:hypothetical protein